MPSGDMTRVPRTISDALGVLVKRSGGLGGWLGVSREPADEIGRDITPVGGRRPEVIDRADVLVDSRTASSCSRRQRGPARRHEDERPWEPHCPGRSPGLGPRTAATTTFEIACAARVPTFRNHCRPSTGGTSKPTISSSGRSTLARYPGVELDERHSSVAVDASQHHDRLDRRKNRQRVARRRGVRDVATERPAILDLKPPLPAPRSRASAGAGERGANG